MTFRFHDPLWLLLLIPVAVLVLWQARRRRPAVLYSSLQGLGALPVTLAQRGKRLLPLLRLLGLACLVLALGRPQQGREEYRVRTEGIAIMLAVDRSGSMQGLDFELDEQRVERLEVVKKVIQDFVGGDDELPGRPDDWIGLVTFGGFAESRCPLTLDHGALLAILERVQLPRPIRDRRGRILDREFFDQESATAIGDALALSVERLRRATAASRVLILLSDGEHNAGIITPEQGTALAQEHGIRVYTIGVGTTGRVPVRVEDERGRKRLVAQQFRLDETTLTAIAEGTGGAYFNAQTTDALTEVYARIDELEKTAAEDVLYTDYRELYAQLVVPGLGLLLLDLLLCCTRFRTLP